MAEEDGDSPLSLGALLSNNPGAYLAQQQNTTARLQARQREILANMLSQQRSPWGQDAVTTSGSAVGSWAFGGGLNRHPKTGKPLADDDFYAEVKDGRGRLHSVNGAPGRKWSDGYEEFFWHGVMVPELVARTPEKITVAMIEIEDNAEVRRVMIDRYGQQRYMVDCGAALVSKDETGELYKKNMGQREEPLVFVKVKNSTPEPDGSIKDYFLRVPPQTKTARAGVAWTFGLDPKAYVPQQQT